MCLVIRLMWATHCRMIADDRCYQQLMCLNYIMYETTLRTNSQGTTHITPLATQPNTALLKPGHVLVLQAAVQNMLGLSHFKSSDYFCFKYDSFASVITEIFSRNFLHNILLGEHRSATLT